VVGVTERSRPSPKPGTAFFAIIDDVVHVMWTLPSQSALLRYVSTTPRWRTWPWPGTVLRLPKGRHDDRNARRLSSHTLGHLVGRQDGLSEADDRTGPRILRRARGEGDKIARFETRRRASRWHDHVSGVGEVVHNGNDRLTMRRWFGVKHKRNNAVPRQWPNEADCRVWPGHVYDQRHHNRAVSAAMSERDVPMPGHSASSRWTVTIRCYRRRSIGLENRSGRWAGRRLRRTKRPLRTTIISIRVSYLTPSDRTRRQAVGPYRVYDRRLPSPAVAY